MKTVSLAYFNEHWRELESMGWFFDAYLDYDYFGIPRMVELKRKNGR